MSDNKKTRSILRRLGKSAATCTAYSLGTFCALCLIVLNADDNLVGVGDVDSGYYTTTVTTEDTTSTTTTTTTQTSPVIDTTASVSSQSSEVSTELTTTTTTTTTTVPQTTTPLTTTTTYVYTYVSDGTRPYIYDCTLSDDLQQYIYDTCVSVGVEYELVMAVIKKESNFKTNAVNYNGSCVGLMQLHYCNKSYAKTLGVTDLSDPYGNVLVGINLIANLRAKYSLTDALICYNMGEGGAKRYLGGSTSYSRKVLEYYYDYLSHNTEAETN